MTPSLPHESKLISYNCYKLGGSTKIQPWEPTLSGPTQINVYVGHTATLINVPFMDLINDMPSNYGFTVDQKINDLAELIRYSR